MAGETGGAISPALLVRSGEDRPDEFKWAPETKGKIFASGLSVVAEGSNDNRLECGSETGRALAFDHLGIVSDIAAHFRKPLDEFGWGS